MKKYLITGVLLLLAAGVLSFFLVSDLAYSESTPPQQFVTLQELTKVQAQLLNQIDFLNDQLNFVLFIQAGIDGDIQAIKADLQNTASTDDLEERLFDLWRAVAELRSDINALKPQTHSARM